LSRSLPSAQDPNHIKIARVERAFKAFLNGLNYTVNNVKFGRRELPDVVYIFKTQEIAKLSTNMGIFFIQDDIFGCFSHIIRYT
jgi:hypothetical protein